jgi:2-amino-4,5-dihydroxy-6-oxo-7-(phosphooxy)heptanoate synthase
MLDTRNLTAPDGLPGARRMRLERLRRHGTGGLLITPLDHSMASGPVTPQGWSLDGLVGALARGGSDAVILHKGSVRRVSPERFRDLALIIHLNARTSTAADPDERWLITSVEEALALGADAVSFHLNLGSATEDVQLRDLGRVSRDCERWNVPLLVMAYPRGPRIRDPGDPDLVLQAVTVAADLGADLVKTSPVTDCAALPRVIDAAPVPVLLAGGAPRPGRDLSVLDVLEAMAAGVAGFAMGRRLFRATDPELATRAVADIIHRPFPAPLPDLEENTHVHPYPTLLA